MKRNREEASTVPAVVIPAAQMKFAGVLEELEMAQAYAISQRITELKDEYAALEVLDPPPTDKLAKLVLEVDQLLTNEGLKRHGHGFSLVERRMAISYFKQTVRVDPLRPPWGFYIHVDTDLPIRVIEPSGDVYRCFILLPEGMSVGTVVPEVIRELPFYPPDIVRRIKEIAKKETEIEMLLRPAGHGRFIQLAKGASQRQ